MPSEDSTEDWRSLRLMVLVAETTMRRQQKAPGSWAYTQKSRIDTNQMYDTHL